MSKTLKKSGEDYLEAIYTIKSKYNKMKVKSVDIANYLGVSKPSTNRALNILIEYGYVEKEDYGAVTLTDCGINLAKSIKRKHDNIKLLLTKLLGVSEAQAEIDACKIEHTLSHETTQKLEELISKLNTEECIAEKFTCLVAGCEEHTCNLQGKFGV
ncbi:MAG: metal-dependent transcriptional regulator [Firmicutes bacterium]|nr:metal-dependent transcriptional regulator [Bacillota bacterium]